MEGGYLVRCQLCCSSLAYCHPSGGTRVGVMLPWCEDGKVPHQALSFIWEAVCMAFPSQIF